MSKILKQFSAKGKEYKLKHSFGKYKIFMNDDSSNMGMAVISKPIATFNKKDEPKKSL